MDMFAQASRLGLRFQTTAGQMSVEDLWNLPISATGNKPSLENIGRSLRSELKDQDDAGSLFGSASVDKKAVKVRKELQLKFDIVKFIGEQLVKERDRAAKRAESRAAQQRIMELIQKRQDEALAGKPLEELQALLAQTSVDAGDDEE